MNTARFIVNETISTAFFTSFSVLGSRGAGATNHDFSPVGLFCVFLDIFFVVFFTICSLLHIAYGFVNFETSLYL